MDFEFRRLADEGKEELGTVRVLMRPDGNVTIKSAEGVVLLMILEELRALRAALGNGK